MKTIFYILAVLVPLAVTAQKEDKAKALLDEVYQKVKSYDNIYIDFKYALQNPRENINQETRGNVTLKGDKYHFNYMGVTKIFDGKKSYTIIPENEEIIVESAETEEENTISPSGMLTFYRNGYKYEWGELKNVKGRKIQYVKLIPIDTHAEVTHILLGIDAQTKHIYQLTETGKNNTRTVITVTGFKTNQPVSDKLFTFNTKKYKDEGYYIVRN